MNFKRNLKNSWTFAVAAAIFIALSLISNVSDDLMEIALLLLAGTLTYTIVKQMKRLKKEGKGNNFLMIYGVGFLSSMWVVEAIEYLF
ncbi:MAG: hypothetical protein GX921_04295 [Bacteroidales bacterium]|nr:hypothetical protein [Bacteroidales bacterium]